MDGRENTRELGPLLRRSRPNELKKGTKKPARPALFDAFHPDLSWLRFTNQRSMYASVMQ
jgi:hypothetical protein